MDKELLYRFFSGTASEAERIQIRNWADASPENMKELLRERNLHTAIILVGKKESFMSKVRQTWYKRTVVIHACRYAAIFVSAVLLSWFIVNLKDDSFPMQQITVPLGQYMNMTLADGSSVYLNSGTTLKYPTKFTDKCRVVEIDGEAFFQIVHTKNNAPFIVRTFKGTVEVLGTKFNVEAYKNKNIFMTSLLEGSVKVETDTEQLILQSNERATVIHDKLIKSKIEDNSYYRWTDGIISFNNITFGSLMTEFEKIYGVKIIIHNSAIENSLCLGKFRRIDGLEYALKVLQVDMPFTYKRDFEKQIIYIN
ncbi:FecR family protein [Bacteroides sp.]